MGSQPISGPGSIGQPAELAVGVWTDIVNVIAPASASAGDLIEVEVQVRNLADYPIYISVSGRHDGIDAYFSPDYAVVAAGQTYSFTYSFTMPNNDIRFRIWSWYWPPMDVWYQDDYSFVDIALEVEAEYQGTLTRKELEYDETWRGIPVH